MTRIPVSGSVAAVFLGVVTTCLFAAEPGGRYEKSVKQGLEYLATHQLSDGGWGEASPARAVPKPVRKPPRATIKKTAARKPRPGSATAADKAKDPSDMANTCLAALALVRSGSTPKEGPYAKNIDKAFTFIAREVESSDNTSLFVTERRNTQVQRKIGPYADTFLTALVLAELKGGMADRADEHRRSAALAKTVGKIERNQQPDGGFTGNSGWAPVHSQALCGKALSRAWQAGVAVKGETFNSDCRHVIAGLGVGGGAAVELPFVPLSPEHSPGLWLTTIAPATGGDAGVQIYGESAKLCRLQALATVFRGQREGTADAPADQPTAEKHSDRALAKSSRLADVEAALKTATASIVGKLGDNQFLAGYGNNGGEEFLSYMNISEALSARGGDEWQRWNKTISSKVADSQNIDGSWSGSHCITGRTFCTSAALLTLMADRAPGAPQKLANANPPTRKLAVGD